MQVWVCVHTRVHTGLQGSTEKAEDGWEWGLVSSAEEEQRAAQTSKGSQRGQLEEKRVQHLQVLPPWGGGWEVGGQEDPPWSFPNYLTKVNLT